MQAAAGSRIWLDVEELGVRGWARVMAVEPCPEIAGGPGRVVTATFSHVNATVQRLELAVEGAAEGRAVEVLEPTAGHPLFSLTRGDWVKAGELRPGERLQTQSGPAQVLSLTASPGAQRVFNFEVEGEHEYVGGGLGARSHNSCVKGATKVRVPAIDNYRGRFNADRHSRGLPRLPDDYDAHHRIPQEYVGHPDFQDFDFHDPSNIQGIKGSRAEVNRHQDVTNDWAEFRRENPNATGEQIRSFADSIDAKYQHDWFQ